MLGEDGKPVRLTMGSYGIGVSRLVAVIAEQHHDELGLRWPSSVSPFDVHVVIANKDEAARAGARELAAELDRLGVEVLLDDRKASPGVKFKDAELLGVPWIVVVGRGWADGVVELRNRFTGETREVAVDERGRRRSRRRSRGLATTQLPPGKATVIGEHAEHPLPARRRDGATASAPSPRTPGPASIGRLLEHRPPRDGGVLLHPHREVGGVGRVVDLDRQLIAGGGQRRVDRPRPRASRWPSSRRSRCSAIAADTRSLSSGVECADTSP